MTFENPFFQSAESIVASKRAAQNSGRRLDRWQSHGIMFHPDTPLSIRNALCVYRPLDDEEWAREFLAEPAATPESPAPEKAQPISTTPLARK